MKARRWWRRLLGTTEPTSRTLVLDPPCSVCGRPATHVRLTESSRGWRLTFRGIAAGGGAGDPTSDGTARAIIDALSVPYDPATIRAAGFHDDFGYCMPCERFYCGEHWQLSTTGGGTCPSGHFKSLDPHWSPDDD